jgi:O-acetyl-ADP-ribose deacetylase (regulator of RNase III)
MRPNDCDVSEVKPLAKITFCDLNIDYVNAMQEVIENEFKFNSHKDLPFTIEAVCKDILKTQADFIVAPGNSFGVMSGGLDKVLRDYFGFQLQRDVQRYIKNSARFELLVGESIVISVHDDNFNNVIYAPTMRSPQKITDYEDVFLSTRSAISNLSGMSKVPSVSIAAMGGLCGQVPPLVCAKKMFDGIADAVNTFNSPRFTEITSW